MKKKTISRWPGSKTQKWDKIVSASTLTFSSPADINLGMVVVEEEHGGIHEIAVISYPCTCGRAISCQGDPGRDEHFACILVVESFLKLFDSCVRDRCKKRVCTIWIKR